MHKTKLIYRVFIILFIQYFAFTLLNETSCELLYIAFYGLAAITSILCLSQKTKIKTKYEFSNLAFYLISIISWTVLNLTLFGITLFLLDNDILQGSGGWFSGLEYIILPFFYELQLIAILILNLLLFFIKKIFKLDQKTPEERKKLLKNFLKILAIIIVSIIILRIIYTCINELLYKKDINKIKQNSEILFNHDVMIKYQVCIDFDEMIASVLYDNRLENKYPIYKLSQAEYQKFLNEYHEIRTVYNSSDYMCLIFNDFGTEDAIAIINNSTLETYVIHDGTEESYKTEIFRLRTY